MVVVDGALGRRMGNDLGFGCPTPQFQGNGLGWREVEQFAIQLCYSSKAIVNDDIHFWSILPHHFHHFAHSMHSPRSHNHQPKLSSIQIYFQPLHFPFGQFSFRFGHLNKKVQDKNWPLIDALDLQRKLCYPMEFEVGFAFDKVVGSPECPLMDFAGFVLFFLLNASKWPFEWKWSFWWARMNHLVKIRHLNRLVDHLLLVDVQHEVGRKGKWSVDRGSRVSVVNLNFAAEIDRPQLGADLGSHSSSQLRM